MTQQVQICIIIVATETFRTHLHTTVTAAGPKINIDSIDRYIMQGQGRVYTVYTILY